MAYLGHTRTYKPRTTLHTLKSDSKWRSDSSEEEIKVVQRSTDLVVFHRDPPLAEHFVLVLWLSEIDGTRGTGEGNMSGTIVTTSRIKIT